jgi:hypothetical protein
VWPSPALVDRWAAAAAAASYHAAHAASHRAVADIGGTRPPPALVDRRTNAATALAPDVSTRGAVSEAWPPAPAIGGAPAGC